MPPRHGKSELVSVWFLAWFIIMNPTKRIIFASYEADFAATFGRRVRNLVEALGPMFGVRIAQDSSAANRWDTTAGGGMFTTGVGGPMTGKGAHLLVLDDPIKNAEEAYSESRRKAIWEWWQSTAYTRLEPDGVAIVVMTRWHEDDLAGRLEREEKAGGEKWDKLVLSALAEEGDPLGRAPGEALWPARYDLDALLGTDRAKGIKRAVGSRVWAALYQQHPAPDEGGILKRGWWKFYDVVPTDFDEMLQSWDMSFKDENTSDYVCGGVWGRKGADRYLLPGWIHDRLDIVATLAAVRSISALHPKATTKLVEDKANGTAVIALLNKEIEGLIPVEPLGGKVVRAVAAAPVVESGNLYLPSPELEPRVEEFISECASFPNGAHDDYVDMFSQAQARMASVGFIFV